MGHFSNDGNFLLFPVLITYYSLIPGISLILLGAIAIIYNALSGLLSTPIGRFADRTDRDAFLFWSVRISPELPESRIYYNGENQQIKHYEKQAVCISKNKHDRYDY